MMLLNILNRKETITLEIFAGIIDGFARESNYTLNDLQECFNVSHKDAVNESNNLTHTNESTRYFIAGDILLTSGSPNDT
jgi:hypothetical protein